MKLLNQLSCFVLGSSMISLGADNPLNEEAFRSRSRLRLAELPAYFIENCGQWNDSIRFVAGKGPWSACFENHAIEVRAGRAARDGVRLTLHNVVARPRERRCRKSW
jgi:hypothetical protein